MEINYAHSRVTKYIATVVCLEHIKDELEKHLGDSNFILFESKVLERILWMRTLAKEKLCYVTICRAKENNG